MITRTTLAAILSSLLVLTATGCAVPRGQESVGAYIDDSAITTAVKARFVEVKTVDAAAISVETLKGTVRLSGFSKSTTERAMAGSLARKIDGVKAVKNEITARQ